MSDAEKSRALGRFLGINNVDDATRLVPIVVDHEYAYPLATAVNVDIDNTFRLTSRKGFTEQLAGADIHSLWSDGSTGLFVDGTALRQLNDDLTARDVGAILSPGLRMSYVPWNERVYYTNRRQIGYVENWAAYPLADPQKQFKMPLPPGQFIEYYRGCLYVADDKTLYMSDPLCHYFDVRYGYKQFASTITLLRAVDDGLYIGDDKVWWVSGKSGDEFDRTEAYSSRPIPFTDVWINGQNVGAGLKGKVAIWTGENGICLGDNDGAVRNLTDFRYLLEPTRQGAGFIRENNNVRHYLNSLF